MEKIFSFRVDSLERMQGIIQPELDNNFIIRDTQIVGQSYVVILSKCECTCKKKKCKCKCC
jgi:hypothetical protein